MSKNQQGSTRKRTKPPAADASSTVGGPGHDAPANHGKANVPEPKVEKKTTTHAHEHAATITETPPPTPNPEMEIHHPQLHHKPKPWKEYLIEGLMIFIAVMMGFISENIREDITDNEHVKQLTTQLVQDLKADTVKLDTIYAFEQQILKTDDSLFAILQQPLAKIDTRKLQQFAADSHSIFVFYPSTGAAGAIKNELHLKQFSETEIIGRFSKFEQHIDLLHTVEGVTLQYQRNYLDPFLYEHFMPANLNNAFYHTSPVDAQIRNLNQQDLTRLATQMVLIRINTNELMRDNRLVKSDAAELLKYVVKQYDVKDN